MLDVAHRREEESHSAEADGDARKSGGRVAQDPARPGGIVVKEGYVAAPVATPPGGGLGTRESGGCGILQIQGERRPEVD